MHRNCKKIRLRSESGTDPVEDMWADIYAKYQSDGMDDVIEQVNAELNK